MKSIVLFAFLGILALSAYTNGAAVTNNVDLGTAVANFYKSFLKMMPCGDPALKLPILAPYTLEYLPVDLETDYYRVNGSIANVYITGMNNVDFLKYTYDESTGIFTFDVFAPQLQLLAESHISAWAILAGYPAQMADKGLLNVKLVDIRVVGSFELASNAQGFMRMSDINFNFYLGDVAADNWNKDWDIAANNFLNEQLRNFLLMYVQQIQVQVNQAYNTLVLPIVNDALAQVTEQQLISFFVQLSQQYNSVGCQA